MRASTTSKARIAIVDDDPTFRRGLELVLDDAYVVRSYPSATKLLEALGAGEEFRLIVTDVQMPEMGGLALIRTLRERFPKHADRVCILTGMPLDVRGEHEGVPVLLKPATAPQILAFLDAQLAAARARRSDAG
jgi:CheY-like chemotaxis protein